jgi:hypothetical protein
MIFKQPFAVIIPTSGMNFRMKNKPYLRRAIRTAQMYALVICYPPFYYLRSTKAAQGLHAWRKWTAWEAEAWRRLVGRTDGCNDSEMKTKTRKVILLDGLTSIDWNLAYKRLNREEATA